MHSWKRISIAGVLLLVCLAAALIVYNSGKTTEGNPAGKISEDRQEPYRAALEPQVPDTAADNPQDPFIDVVRKAYGQTISDIRTQISLIEELIAYFSKQYGEDWQNRIASFLQEAFPEHAGEILERMDKLQAYNRWLEDNSSEILGMPRDERNRILWEKRNRIFGSEAQDIWSSELDNDRILDALDLIRASRDVSLEDKLGFYVHTIEEIYGEGTDRFLSSRGYEIMSAFLEADAVQEDLRAMESDQRRQSIRDIRKAMGFDDEVLQRLEDLDAVRDRRWETGALYMQARQDMIAHYTGDEQEQMIDQIREQYFGPKAATIKAEEESGFFRFARKRVYGRN